MRLQFPPSATYDQEQSDRSTIRTARTVRVDEQRRVWVDIGRGPQVARLSRTVARSSLFSSDVSPQEVLVTFDGAGHPVIVDVIEETLVPPVAHGVGAGEIGKGEVRVVEARRLLLDAEDELVLRCGKATITLTRAGKVIIRGAYVSTTATGANRICGGSVQIN